MKDLAIVIILTHPSPLPGGDNNLIGGDVDKVEDIKLK